MADPVRLAIAGMDHGHVRWILNPRQRETLEIVGFYEPNTDLAGRYAEEFGFSLELVYEDLPTMLDKVKPQGVIAMGSIYAHLQVVEACAPRKIHALVEKPLAVNMEHASRMAQLARQHNIHLLTNYETTWYATTFEAYRLLHDEGKLGELRKVVVHDGHQGPVEVGCNAEFLAWLTDPELNGGGAIMDFGCYGANLITWLMRNRKPDTVTAITQQMKPKIYPKVDDESLIVVTYDGVQGIIQGSWNWPVSRKDMEVYGATGYIRTIDATHMHVRETNADSEQHITLEPRPAPHNDPFDYFAAVISGAITPDGGDLWSLTNNLIVVQILDAARVSARRGQTVRM